MMNEQMTIFNYWQELWREATPKTKRVLRIMVLVYGVLLLLGSYLAATQMAAIAPMVRSWPSMISASISTLPSALG